MFAIKILLLFFIILIAFLIIIFSESIHVHALIQINDSLTKILLKIRYYHIQLTYDINHSQIQISIVNRFFSKKIKTISLNQKNKNQKESKTQDDNNENLIDKLKDMILLVNDYKDDILEIISFLPDILKFSQSHYHMKIGVDDNNSTIKLCNILWMISAPFYLTGIEIVIMPLINQLKLDIDSKISFDINLANIMKLFFKVISNKNLRKLILNKAG